MLAAPLAHAGSFLDEMRVPDTCGTAYADKLATCAPFRCTKPSPMAAMYAAIPKDAQAKLEKNIESLSSKQRAEMKAKITSSFEIKGLDAQGRCQTITMAMPGQRMDCNFDQSVLQQVSEYSRLIAKATDFGSASTSHVVNGKMVTESTVTIDGVKMADPWTTALSNGQCSMMIEDADVDWVSMSQMNRMSHFEFNLLEHGKHVDGHIQILNSADGKVLFDKDVETSHDARKINLNPGTFDIQVVGKNAELAPVWFRGVKLGEANIFTKNVEFYAISGTLKLTVNLNGKPSRGAAIYIKDPDTKEWLGRWSVSKKPVFSFMPASIKLPETLTGRYQVFVTAVPNGLSVPDNATYKDFLVTINNSKTIEKTIDFGETSQVQAPVEKATGNSANTIFILDASGSMWGQIEGKPKISIAKEVMAKLVPELPDSSRIGLIAYGHRRKGDCNDVETLVNLGGNHKQAVLSAVKGLNARGKTPLTRSINQAFKILQSEKQPSTIILVSDGIESCNADPCETVKAAKKYGIDFILYTVGFGLNKKESAQLQCMARAGGGEYFQANNAEELLKSARKAVQPMGVLKLTVKVNGKVNDLMYRIEDASTGKIIRQPVLPTSSGRTIQLPGGEYNVFVLPAGVSGAGEQKLSLRMKAGEVIKKTLSFGKGVLHLTVMVNGKPAHALIHVEDSNTHQWVYESSVFGFDTPLDINLEAGKVDIVIQAGGRDIPERRVRGVEIMVGKTTAQIIPIEVKAATVISADANGMEQDTDRPGGGDFRHVVPTVDNPAICQKACADDPQCKAWTYVKPNTIQGPKPNCWLKTMTPAAVSNACCVSGVKAM